MTAELTDASTSSYDLVVGADGVHSRVRELCLRRAAGAVVHRAGGVAGDGSPAIADAARVRAGHALHVLRLAHKAGMPPVDAREMYVFLVQNIAERARPPEPSSRR